MKILICTKRDLTSMVAMNLLLPALRDFDLRVVVAERTRAIEEKTPELAQIKFLERDFPIGVIEPFVEQLVQSGQGGPAPLLTFPRLAAAFRVPVQIVRHSDDTLVANIVETWRPDILLSIRYSYQIPVRVIAATEHALNFHPGVLPRLAGLFPHFHAMLQGDPFYVATVHRMVPDLDAGAVVLEQQVPVDTATSAHMANIELHRVGAAMLSDIVGRIAAGWPLHERSPGVLPERLNYYPSRAALDAFAERGLKLVDMAAYDGLIREFLPEIRTGGWK